MRVRSHGAGLLGISLALALVMGACGGGGTTTDDDSETTGTGGGGGGDSDTLVVGQIETPPSLDPARVYDKAGSDVLFNTTNRLVEFAPGASDVGPGLATEWQISDDGLEYTFTLREGVKFHDGSDFDSEDVKYSLERSLAINHPDGASFLLGGIETVEAPDPQTVKITIGESNVTFLSRLNYTVASIIPSDSDVYKVPDAPLEGAEAGAPPAAADADKFLTNTEIVGTGPYKLVEFKPGESLTYERNEDYWGDPPAIKTVTVQFYETAPQMKNALEAGEIDLNLNEMGPAERASLEEGGEVTITKGAGGRIRYIVLDTTQAPFDDVKVRRAMAAAIDRERIIDEVFEGAGVPLFSMIPTAFDSYKDYISEVDDTLAEPVEITLWFPLNKYGDTEADVAETIKRSLEESGQFTVTLQSSDYAAEYSKNLNNHTYPAYLLG